MVDRACTTRVSLLCASLFLIWIGRTEVPAQPTGLVDTLFSGMGVSAARTGSDVALDGDRLAVGAPESMQFFGSGRVFLRNWTGSQWELETTIEGPAAGTWDRFGKSVALEGDLLIVGARAEFHVYRLDAATPAWNLETTLPALFSNGDPGMVTAVDVTGAGSPGERLIVSFDRSNYQNAQERVDRIYRRAVLSGVWVLEYEATSSMNSAFDSRQSVAIEGDLAVHVDETPGGSITVLRYSPAIANWIVEFDLATFPVAGGNEWRGVAISGDRVIVGRPRSHATVFAFDPGSQTWTLEQELFPSIAFSVTQHFGWAVALAGDRALVDIVHRSNHQAPLDPVATTIYQRGAAGTWQVESLIPFPEGQGQSQPGTVALTSTHAAVGGASFLNDAGIVATASFDPTTLAWIDTGALTHAFGANSDRFGTEVSLSGDLLAVSAYTDSDFGFSSGSVRLLRIDAVTGIPQEEARLSLPDPLVNQYLGLSLASDEDVVVASFAAGSIATREIAVFERDPVLGDWFLATRLQPPVASAASSFGGGVAIADGVIAVGSPRDAEFGEHSGSVSVFRRDAVTGDWLFEERLTPPDPQKRFGAGVALVEGQLWVSASASINAALPVPDRVHRYTFDVLSGTWVAAPPLSLPGLDPGSGFGQLAAVDGDRIALGIFTDNTFPESPTSTRVYRVDAASGDAILEQTLAFPVEPGAGAYLTALALSGDRLLKGGSSGFPTVARSFRLLPGGVGYQLESNIVDPAPTNGTFFGGAIAILGDSAWIGAVLDDLACGNGDDDCSSGAVFQFDLTDVPPAFDCNGNGVADTVDMLTGVSLDVDLDGFPDECEPAYVRGDADGSLGLDITDAINALDWLFNGLVVPCERALDMNDDAVIDLVDPIRVLGYLFTSFPAPPAPFPNCGLDPTADLLTCAASSCP